MPNISGCTNFGGLDMNGNVMFTIKTKSNNALSYISRYPNFAKTKHKNHKYAKCMGHGNDLAFNPGNGHLYVAPCDSFV